MKTNLKEADKKQSEPPRWAVRLLCWYCRPELLEDLQGDLNEYFDRNVKVKGARYARRVYVLDVLKFFRLYTIKKPDFSGLLHTSCDDGQLFQDLAAQSAEK